MGREVTISAAVPVGGGCISDTSRLQTTDGETVFLKWGSELPPGIFRAEAEALEALAATRDVRVPAVIAVEDPPGRQGHTGTARRWIVLEWIEPGPPTSDGWSRLGASLAALHRQHGQDFGWPAANFIGPLPQQNTPLPSWADFWRSRRLEPQLERACDSGALDAEDRRRFDALLDGLESRLGAASGELTRGGSLLHGDLWSGNVHFGKGGAPALIDPSTYYGHREVDLAMSELFGGFDRSFYDAYQERWPLLDGYRPLRRAVYQLYYLLVHVNLFGGSYLPRTRAALTAAGA